MPALKAAPPAPPKVEQGLLDWSKNLLHHHPVLGGGGGGAHHQWRQQGGAHFRLVRA